MLNSQHRRPQRLPLPLPVLALLALGSHCCSASSTPHSAAGADTPGDQRATTRARAGPPVFKRNYQPEGAWGDFGEEASPFFLNGKMYHMQSVMGTMPPDGSEGGHSFFCICESLPFQHLFKTTAIFDCNSRIFSTVPIENTETSTKSQINSPVLLEPLAFSDRPRRRCLPDDAATGEKLICPESSSKFAFCSAIGTILSCFLLFPPRNLDQCCCFLLTFARFVARFCADSRPHCARRSEALGNAQAICLCLCFACDS